ncbi:hypothetical protein Rsub_10695 [Raphidocelis subcapitata]|uniref:Uncharacterized protein n=1 Tax=Raphidocelis subcapitata TaxID=307507 RepID=A0A2V0PMB0_9CHLO|nr:hypothetical protein Rsub_10695 [Raphidocelis subcapitata]|eukprot:GBF98195.1 hypothetical protein Rsub_10695 [Raphidocelis subcapitata]
MAPCVATTTGRPMAALQQQPRGARAPAAAPPQQRCRAAAAPRRAPAPSPAAAAATAPPRRAVAARVAEPGSSGAPAGQVSSELMASMEAKIAAALEAQAVRVQDMYGDGRHVSIDVVAAAFEGKNSVARQRLVYKAIWLELQETVHAVDAMTTKTPEEAGKQ